MTEKQLLKEKIGSVYLSAETLGGGMSYYNQLYTSIGRLGREKALRFKACDEVYIVDPKDEYVESCGK